MLSKIVKMLMWNEISKRKIQRHEEWELEAAAITMQVGAQIVFIAICNVLF